MKTFVVILLCAVAASEAFFFSKQPAWNKFKVTWGLNPFKSFNNLPTEVTEAKKQGFVEISSGCESGNFLGHQYVKDNDYAVVLLFDKNGFIAGMQIGVPLGLANGFPSSKQPLVQSGQHKFMTAYFVDPKTICSTGRSKEDFKATGTGTGLYLQMGPNPISDILEIPNDPTELEATTKFKKGKCFPTMGLHYWYDTHATLSCDEMVPVFLLYNGGKLDGFGWAMTADLTSPRLEHPKNDVITKFMNDVPTCLLKVPHLSTMHIYFTNPYTDMCFVG